MTNKLQRRYSKKLFVGLLLSFFLFFSGSFSITTSAQRMSYKPSAKRSYTPPKYKSRSGTLNRLRGRTFPTTRSIFDRDSARLTKEDIGRLIETGKEYVPYKSFYLTGLNKGTSITIEFLKRIPVEKTKILVLPLVTDSKTNENIDYYFGDQKISVPKWDRENLKRELGKYSQMLIFALGHVKNGRYIKKDPGDVVEFSISLDELFEFGKNNIIFPLGCKSAMFTGRSGVLTEFNTADAVVEIYTACSKAHFYEDLFASLSKPSLRLVIDASTILALKRPMLMNMSDLSDISYRDKELLIDKLAKNKKAFKETRLLETPVVKLANSSFSKMNSVLLKADRVYIPPSLEQISITAKRTPFTQAYPTDSCAFTDYSDYHAGDYYNSEDDDSSYEWILIIPVIIILLLLPTGTKGESVHNYFDDKYFYKIKNNWEI